MIETDRMGRYIDEILQPGEKVLYSTNAHWIFFLPAIAGWIVAIVFVVLSYLVPAGAPALLCLSMAAISAVIALYKTVTAWFHRWTIETDVTNLRVIHKTGFITRQTFEMSLDKVESVDVNQSILGRIFQLWQRHDSRRWRGRRDDQDHCVAAGVPQFNHGAVGARASNDHAIEFFHRLGQHR
jgi:membrane protein YdbS with pleckstrin-like domain